MERTTGLDKKTLQAQLRKAKNIRGRQMVKVKNTAKELRNKRAEVANDRRALEESVNEQRLLESEYQAARQRLFDIEYTIDDTEGEIESLEENSPQV